MEKIIGAFPEILKYGATGLSALLFFFAYLLLRQQSQKDQPDISVLQTIKTFMYVSVALVVISLASTAIEAKRKGGWYVKSTIELRDAKDKKIERVKTQDADGKPITEDLITFLNNHLKVSVQPPRDSIGAENVRLSMPEYDEGTIITYSIDGFTSDEKTLEKDNNVKVSRKGNTIELGKIVLRQVSEYSGSNSELPKAGSAELQPPITQ